MTAVSTRSIQMTKVILTSTVTYRGNTRALLSFKEEKMAQLISFSAGMSTKMGLEILIKSSGSDWIKFIAWRARQRTTYALVSEVGKMGPFMLITIILRWLERIPSTQWLLVLSKTEVTYRVFAWRPWMAGKMQFLSSGKWNLFRAKMFRYFCHPIWLLYKSL